MKIVYLWIEDYGCLKNIGINFKPNYKFQFIDGKEPLLKLISWDSDPIMDFYSLEENFDLSKNNINISAIVGNNGMGKTTLFRFFSENDSSIKGQYCLICMDKNKFVVYVNRREMIKRLPICFNDENTENNLKNMFEDYNDKTFKIKSLWPDELNLLYYTNAFGYQNFENRLTNISPIDNFNNDTLFECYNRMFHKELNFVKLFSKKDKNAIVYSVPSNIVIQLRRLDVRYIIKQSFNYYGGYNRSNRKKYYVYEYLDKHKWYDHNRHISSSSYLEELILSYKILYFTDRIKNKSFNINGFSLLTEYIKSNHYINDKKLMDYMESILKEKYPNDEYFQKCDKLKDILIELFPRNIFQNISTSVLMTFD